MHVKPTFNITGSLLLGINHSCFNGYKGVVGEKNLNLFTYRVWSCFGEVISADGGVDDEL